MTAFGAIPMASLATPPLHQRGSSDISIPLVPLVEHRTHQNDDPFYQSSFDHADM